MPQKSTSSKQTPADLTIQPRNLSFEAVGRNPRWWAGGDPIATAFYNALSTTFPQGERFFIEGVRNFRDKVSADLKPQITAFITQEAMHTREHVMFNEAVERHGYDLSRIEALQKAMLDDTRAKGPIVQLAATMALEHFTAILAHGLLARPDHLEGAPAETQDLWRWHSMEEIEHKAVAFDTFNAITADLSGLRRWHIRSLVMVLATVRFARLVFRAMVDLLAQDGIDLGRRKAAFLHFMLLKPGILRHVMGGYLQFYLPGFHPWQHDDRDLLKREEARFAAMAA
jgi:predicted metal-dependent hydrolase